ncbi:hypothetical protein FA15DRAFT_663757 [Coprinopsis marcescibilis]|uniref:Peptidase C15, pyroglutamyl peptidase I-like protein n=1 Tax=Coprinopsis marcescibilis TaxID=230819 RepID=A0A5C3LCC3_COPMA|nr:hypothetical protein FA15DRAFT_663757 [Coprinopsis marcescibilis]
MNHRQNPSWLAAKALHNTTITSDQCFQLFQSSLVPTTQSSAANSPIVSNGKRSVGAGTLSDKSKNSAIRSPKTSIPAPVPTVTSPPLPPLPDPGPFNIHITALEIPVLYEAVHEIVPGLHLKPPKLPTESNYIDLPPDFPCPPGDAGYDFIFHVGVAGRGALRMEIIGHKFGYNMKDASGSYCAIVPPPSSHAKQALNATRGPASHPPGMSVPVGAHNVNFRVGPAGSGGFGSMGMGYNNERLGYNPAGHDPQPAIPGSENNVRPVRGFGTAYESFPDEMMTDIDVTRLVQDLKASGITQIYTSMDAGHYLCDFIYYCSLAESKRSSKPMLPYMTGSASGGQTYFANPSANPFYQPGSGYSSNTYYHQQPAGPGLGGPASIQKVANSSPTGSSAGGTGSGTQAAAQQHHHHQLHQLPHHHYHKNRPARVLFMHVPPVNEPLSTEEVTEAIRRIVMWVCRECEMDDIRERMQAPEEGHGPVGGY